MKALILSCNTGEGHNSCARAISEELERKGDWGYSADGLAFYRRLVQEGKDHLKSGGWMLFEIGCTQAEAVMELLKKGGFQEIYVKKDLAGLDRVVGGRKPKQEERKHV